MAQKTRHAEDAEEYERLQQIDIETEQHQPGILGYGKRLFSVLKYTSIHLAIIAATQALLAILLLSVSLTLAPVVVGLVTFAVYANDRVVDVETDAIGKPKQSTFVQRHQNALYTLAALAYGLSVALSTLGGPIALLVTLLPGVFWILYASDWLPRINSRFQRLKNVLFVNTALVATAWAITLTLLPLTFADSSITPLAGFVSSYFFLEVVICTEIPNVRDIEEDAAIGVKTMPVALGIDWTRRVLYLADLTIAALVLYVAAEGHLSFELTVALLVGVVYSMGATTFVGRTDKEDLLSVAVDARDVLVAGVAVVALILL